MSHKNKHETEKRDGAAVEKRARGGNKSGCRQGLGKEADVTWSN